MNEQGKKLIDELKEREENLANHVSQKQILGYTKLTGEQVASVNYLKKMEANILECLNGMKQDKEINQRSLSIAITEIQTGFMWAVRSITRPNGE